MVKVLHVINSFSKAGSEKLVLDITSLMNKKKFDIYVCAISKGNSTDYFKEEFKKNNIKSFCLKKKQNKQRVKTLVRLVNIVKENNIDYIHTHCKSPDFYGRLAGFLTSTPVYSTIHNTRGYSKNVERFLKFITKRYIAISKKVKTYMIEDLNIPEEKIEIIYNGINLERFKNKEKKIKKVKNIIAIGRLKIQKNYKIMLESFQYLIKKLNKNNLYVPDLNIVGDGNERDRLVDLAGKLRIKEKVNFMGLRDDIPGLLKKNDIYLMTSSWEGLSISLIEALASGIPIVASDVGSNNEIVENKKSGILFKKFDAAHIADKIYHLINDEEKRKELSKNAVRSSDKFSIIQTVNKYENLYKN